MNFERGQDPKAAMGIGIDARLKELGCTFKHTTIGEPIFVKEGEKDASESVRPLIWNSQQLRAIADYLDAHPDSVKVIDIVGDNRPTIRAIQGALDDIDAPMGIPWTTPPLPPSKF